MLNKLKDKNPDIKVFSVNDREFEQFGQVLKDYDFSEMAEYCSKNLAVPEKGNVYVPSDAALEGFDVFKAVEGRFYGELPAQAGYCNGNNSLLNALEYHKGSEINVAATDAFLLLGDLRDVADGKYDSAKVIGFYVPKGTALEMYATTLHFSPCKVSDSGFKMIVILPKDTNLPLANKAAGSTLRARNKWLLAHEAAAHLINDGAYNGIFGVNHEVKY